MTNPDELSSIIDRIATDKQTEADIAVLRQVLSGGDRQIATQLGKYNVNIGQGQGVQIGDRTYIELNDEAMQALVRAIQKPSTVLSQFQSLIQDKTEGFVGREYVFDAIQAFLQNNPKGYFTIIGDPGMGKSAILAKYVRDNRCIAHFNVQLQGPNRADQFLESVCKQLVAHYQLPYDPLPSNAMRDGEFLGQLLDEVAQRSNGQPVVIAVDALDEVDSGSYRDANILYLPPHLPNGVYFIMTRRRGVEVPFTTYAPVQITSLLDYQIDSQRDVRLYIQNRVNGSEKLRQQIDERQETIIVFTNKIVDKSESNFMYLRYVLQDIEKGLYKDLSLESFPQGLQGYYDFHWRRMGMTANPLPDAKIKIVYILGEVKQPVSRQQICDFSGEDTRTVQTVLNEWEQFLHELLKDNQKCYSVYHASFGNFLHRKDILEKTGLIIPGIHLLIAKDQLNKWKSYRREFYNLSPEDAEYVLNLPFHLAEAAKEEVAMADELGKLLTEFKFIEYKLSSLTPEPLIEDYDLALACNIQVSEDKKDALKLIQGALRLSANVLTEDKTQLVGQVWGRLLKYKLPDIRAFLEQAKKQGVSWLRTLIPTLRQADNPLVMTLVGHLDSVNAIAILANGQQAISASNDYDLKIWDLKTGTQLHTLEGHTAGIWALAVTPDGKTAISTSQDNTLKVWDIERAVEIKTFWVGELLKSVAITRDGKRALSVSYGHDCIKVWDLENGIELQTLERHQESIHTVVLTPDEKLAISGSTDSDLKVWNLEYGTTRPRN